MKVNLHVHSTASDGLLRPSDVITFLARKGVKICALTDHDTIEGIPEAKQQADKENIILINGTEISTKITDLKITFLNPKYHTLHLLALDFDYKLLVNAFVEKQQAKTKRLTTLVKTLEYDGYNLNLDCEISKKSIIAKTLVEKGYAKNIQEAFNTIINTYYDKTNDDLNITSVVNMVHNAYGKVIWAHPFEILYGVEKETINKQQINLICSALKQIGIDGIEVYYASYSQNQIAFLKEMQNKYNFISSAGTDYHGKSKQELPYVNIESNLLKGVMS